MPYKDRANRTCGFIGVEVKEKTGKFVRRYLRMDRSKGVAEWFADNPCNLPKNAKHLGMIDINFITKVDVAAKLKFKVKHCFVVNTPMRRYYFQGNDEADVEEWVETLNNASKIVVSDEERDEFSQHGSVQSTNPTEEYSYKTEIVAGVVVQKKLEPEDESLEGKGDDTRSLRSISSAISNGSPKHKLTGSRVKPLKQGWAVKQGHLRKNWKRRFFILSTAGFSYFKSDHDKEPIRFIPISEILASKKDQTMLSQYKDNLFFVATTERIYYIQADSPEEMTSWIKCFHDAIHLSSSLKLRPKDDKKLSVNQGTCYGTPTTAATAARKLEASLSLAAPLRNSTYLGKSAITASTATSYRLSSADETFYRSLSPQKSLSVTKPEQPHASSSEESGGLDSSVDSISALVGEEKNVKTKKMFRRSCSGTEMISVEERTNPHTANPQNIERLSFPLSQSVFKVEPEKTKIPSSASFSVSSQSGNRSSASFSSLSVRRSFCLDPKVDHRAAVKPSAVKKKRNTGILFSLNNMLNKKAEKMSSAEKKRRGL